MKKFLIGMMLVLGFANIANARMPTPGCDADYVQDVAEDVITDFYLFHLNARQGFDEYELENFHAVRINNKLGVAQCSVDLIMDATEHGVTGHWVIKYETRWVSKNVNDPHFSVTLTAYDRVDI